MTGLNRDSILGKKDIRVEPLPIPEWDGETVYVKAMNASERAQLEASIIKVGVDGRPESMKIDKVAVMVAFLTLCDENGVRLFTDQKDVQALGEKSAAAINRIAEKAQGMAGMEKGDVEKLLQGLKKAQPVDSPSG